MRKIVFICLFWFFYLNKFQAQLVFSNDHKNSVYVALTYYLNTADYKGWYSTGWYYIDPFETRNLVEGNLKDSCYFYYAYDSDGKIWQGDGRDSFIVEKQKIFKIRNADKQYQINSDSRTFKFFRKIDIENKNAYTIRLTAVDN
jgi:uncharacterized membrane protein